MNQSGWRACVGMWAQRARDISAGVRVLRLTVGLLGLSLLLWGVLLVADGILDQSGTP